MTAKTFSFSALKKQQLFSLLILLLLSIQLQYAQNLKFKHYGLPEGLSQESITSLAKDSLGYLWIGSENGISRFDGTQFTSLLNSNTEINIEGAQITSLLSDNSNLLWIGTAQSGLFVYNISSQKLAKIGNTNIKVTSIARDENNSIYVSYLNDGIYKISKTNSDFTISKIAVSLPQITHLLYVNNTLFCSSDTGKLFAFNPNSSSEIAVKQLNSKSNLGVINNLIATNNAIWICTNSGLYKIAKDLTSIDGVSIKNHSSSTQQNFNVFDFAEINSQYYLATNLGFLELDKQNSEASQFKIRHHYISKNKYDTNAPNGNVINHLLPADDVLFLGGITLDITQVSKNKAIQLVRKELNIGNPSIFSFIKHNNYLFIGTANGLVTQHTQTKQFSKIELANERIRDLEIDIDNNLWVVTTNTIYIISLDNFSPKNVAIIATIPFNKVAIRNLYKDHNNTIWVTTQGDGLYWFTGNISQNNYSCKHFEPEISKNKLSSNFILELNQDEQNNFWVSTQTGLCKLIFNGKNYTKPICTQYFQDKKGLKNNGILSTFLDAENNLWIATHNGLHLYNNKEDNFTYFGKKEGLTNTFIYNIIEDKLNNLWLTTNGGLFRFNKTTKVFSNYTPKDGLQSLEFNLGAAFNDKNTNELYFGGINGFNIINPSKIDNLDKESQLIFTSFSIKDKDVLPEINSEKLSQNITLTEEIQINYNDFPVNLSFSALDFRPNSNLQYVYKLLPDDTQWNSLNDKNSIQLLTLSPKTYTLQIQGVSRGKIWNKAPLQLSLDVKPPWYRSNFAYLTYLVLFLSLVYLYYKITLQRKLAGQEAKRLQDLDDLKSRFITNITHEFRTPLTIILGYLGNLKEQFSAKKETISSLETIEKNSNNLLGLVNQMLDLAKLEQGKLQLNYKNSNVVSYVKHLTNSFLSIAEDNKVQLIFASEQEEIKMDFDAEKLRQIITNLLSNALKFTSEEKKVEITLSRITKNGKLQLKIEVKDQGCGINDVELNKIFDRFYQAQSDTLKVSQGTGIGLALTKELTHLMKGRISVISEIGTGSTFTVLLPITQNAQEATVNTEDFHATIGKTEVLPAVGSSNKDADNHILIVDDNTDMANYISSCLSDDYQITHAPDGSKGLDKAMAQIPDLIISDVMMPVMDGFEMTQKLQQHEATNHIPIIILTSKAMQEEKIEGLVSGADAYLTKPFSKKELQIRIANLIAKRKNLQERYQTEVVVQQKKKVKTSTDKNIIFLNKAIDCIHLFIEDNTFNSEKLARELGLSDSQLYRKLKAISNTSTAIFIRNIRLEKAKELLQTTDLTISEIAYATGFNDPSWFSKTFKITFGESPTEIRK